MKRVLFVSLLLVLVLALAGCATGAATEEPAAEEPAVEEPADEEDAANDIELQVAAIKQAIGRLPDGYRLVLTLYLLEGYDHEEIAHILRISEATSRSQYLRGKRKLLDYLAN